MRMVRRLVVLLASLAAGAAAAQAPPQSDDVAGVYNDEVFEVASILVLARDGRFQWLFSYGALDMIGEGRWTRADDGSIRLDSDPPVVPPRIELVGTQRDPEPGLLVRMADDSRGATMFLDVEAEYSDGSRGRENMQQDGYRFEPEAGRRVVAVSLASGIFDFRSEAFPVPSDGANVLTFRLVPNDLGRADFRGQPVAVQPGGLSFTWRDMELRYSREGAAPEMIAPIANEDAPPTVVEPPVAAGESRGRIDVQLGEPLADMQSRSSYALPASTPAGRELVTNGPVDFSVRIGGRDFSPGRIGGFGLPALVVGVSAQSDRIESVLFWQQARLLPLDEALRRAQAMKTWLEQAAAAAPPTAASQTESIPPFTAVRHDDSLGASASDWAGAARMLAEDETVDAMHLYALPVGEDYAVVMAQNVRRSWPESCSRPGVDCAQGEWMVNIAVFRDSLIGESFQAPGDVSEPIEEAPPEEGPGS